MSVMSLLGKVAGPLISGGLSFLGGERRNNAQEAMSQRQMDWSERMSNTAYQRSMSDMRTAGLNPILAGKLGGASTPGITMPVINDTITPAVSTGLQAMQTMSNVEKQESEVSKIAQEISNLEETRTLTQQQQDQLAWMIYKLKIDANAAGWDELTAREGFRRAEMDNQIRGIITDFFSDNQTLLILNEMGINAGTAVNAATSILTRGRKK